MDYSTTNFYGGKIDPSVFSLDRLNSQGKRVTCIGLDNTDTKNKWFGLIKNGRNINPELISFCEFCADAYFTRDEVYELSDEQNAILSPSLVCDTSKTDICINYGIDRRCLHVNDMRINVNITDKSGKEWRPTMIIPNEKGNDADL